VSRYCGREFLDTELAAMRQMIEQSPQLSRAKLSRLVCEHLAWFKPDGGLKEMSCRVAMLRMQQDGLITLPEARPMSAVYRFEASPVTDPESGMVQPVHELPAPVFHLVSTKKDSRLWNEYMQRYHYLGYKSLPGAQLRYFVTVDGRFVALLGFGAAAWKTAPRDQFIGWDSEQRKKNMHLIVNNARFLILPWIVSKGLASKILARVARLLPGHWQERYGYRPLLLETFVEQDRFHGTCYKAANWIHVGQTQGRGKLDVTHQADIPVKDIWLYPLARHYKNILAERSPAT
jgi:hypothetical protein